VDQAGQGQVAPGAGQGLESARGAWLIDLQPTLARRPTTLSIAMKRCCSIPSKSLGPRGISSPQPLTSHPIPIAIQGAVPLPQQLLGPGKRADLLAGGVGPAGLLGYGADTWMRWGSQQQEPPLGCAPRHTLAEFKRLLDGPRHRPTPAAEHGQVVHRQIGSPIMMVQLKHTEANAWPAGPMARWRILLSITSATMGTYGGDVRNHPLQCA